MIFLQEVTSNTNPKGKTILEIKNLDIAIELLNKYRKEYPENIYYISNQPDITWLKE